ncbi:beta-lactamase regulator AmpE [Shewanella intestini]|uniref:Beta-lactamase regulator AmpE n=1 Tax=Shewanella intestini TaxID=2017544 RepID=A0ABS5I521_9GAMM|nr:MULTISPECIES: beta-lactamase regulator AmpE [Shewanella]MBR9729121.1 beta-lactamase regulator AmpE [Shewanella intestini]MRG37197.1 beta-lactamase regulator AmpE [Shewanella sp. XMDDZSB0408]
MALFSLLVAILVERSKMLPHILQFDELISRYQQAFWRVDSLKHGHLALLAIAIPAVCVFAISALLDGIFFDVFSLLFSVIIAVTCLSHQSLRHVFKKYLQAACRGDAQACFIYAQQLDCHECLQAVNEQELGLKVGESVAWINYRYYGAVALYFVFFGPVGAVLYCSVRYYFDLLMKHNVSHPWVDFLLLALDWLPARIFSFGYVLSGQFTSGFKVWRRQALTLQNNARDIVCQTASAAESIPPQSHAPICVQSTLALLALSKRNLFLLVTTLAVLTIFGVVH